VTSAVPRRWLSELLLVYHSAVDLRLCLAMFAKIGENRHIKKVPCMHRHNGICTGSFVFTYLLSVIIHTHTHTTILRPFFWDYPGEPVPEEIFWTHGARGDIRGRHTDNSCGCHSIGTNQQPISAIPHFYAGCRSCHNPPNLSWLGAGTGILSG